MKKIAIAALVAVALAACSPAATAPSPTAATITPIPSFKATTAPTAAPATGAPAAASPAKTAPAATTAASAPAATSAPASNTGARKVDVTATNSTYSITTLDVKPGEKIEFVVNNTGEEKHNLVGIGEGISLVSPDFDFGGTTSWIWTAPTKLGTFKLQCSYHTTIAPIMVTVKQ